MELRVSVDGVERSVSGITESTTCAQIIYALAHATGQKGRFVLIEKFRNTERSLAPLDRPLEMLRKWGTYSCHVTFMLKHLDDGILPETSDAANAVNGVWYYQCFPVYRSSFCCFLLLSFSKGSVKFITFRGCIFD
ncbi:unnamed protein product [Gongylonema pulchrum]|uniref:Ras-associating domain-containing protein n=1 Tax=Gongylonema pulchrum TaxID=637853 RepID=A0A183DZ44_9BILA|nr:unnamed protein product [Gongylonema pulchrum]